MCIVGTLLEMSHTQKLTMNFLSRFNSSLIEYCGFRVPPVITLTHNSQHVYIQVCDILTACVFVLADNLLWEMLIHKFIAVTNQAQHSIKHHVGWWWLILDCWPE